MFKKKLDIAIVTTLFITVIALASLCGYKNQQIRSLKNDFQEIQEDKKIYQKQYKRYFELSEELQNQLGIYAQ